MNLKSSLAYLASMAGLFSGRTDPGKYFPPMSGPFFDPNARRGKGKSSGGSRTMKPRRSREGCQSRNKNAWERQAHKDRIGKIELLLVANIDDGKAILKLKLERSARQGRIQQLAA